MTRGPPTSTAIGIAFANSMGNLGGISGPKLMAHFGERYGYGAGIISMSVCAAVGVLLLIVVRISTAFHATKARHSSDIHDEPAVDRQALITTDAEKSPLVGGSCIINERYDG